MRSGGRGNKEERGNGAKGLLGQEREGENREGRGRVVGTSREWSGDV